MPIVLRFYIVVRLPIVQRDTCLAEVVVRTNAVATTLLLAYPNSGVIDSIITKQYTMQVLSYSSINNSTDNVHVVYFDSDEGKSIVVFYYYA